jgi:pimeloyl-ACP methyl ester carboxylesterase
VRYLDAGGGKTLVLLHAFPLHADQWLPQLARVPPDWRVVAPDLAGFHGRDPACAGPPDAVTIDGYARDVFEFMTHLDIRRAAIAGLSMGGYIALAMLRLAADRVAGLALADTKATADTDDARAGRDRLIALALSEGAAAVADAMLPRLLGSTTRREQPDLSDAVHRLIAANTADGIVAASRAMKVRPDSTAALQSAACPVTIICGDEDEPTPVADARAMQRVAPHARLVIIPRAGHLSNLENPLPFNAALAAFTRDLDHATISRTHGSPSH